LGALQKAKERQCLYLIETEKRRYQSPISREVRVSPAFELFEYLLVGVDKTHRKRWIRERPNEVRKDWKRKGGVKRIVKTKSGGRRWHMRGRGGPGGKKINISLTNIERFYSSEKII